MARAARTKTQDPELDPVDELEPAEFEPADGWATMETAPTGGKPCFLAGLLESDDLFIRVPLIAEAYLHETREYRGSASRFVPVSWWKILNTPDKVPFEPLAWARWQ